MPELIRSFIAFDVDSDDVLKRLAETQNMLVNIGADLKLVDSKNIHITVRFLGDINLSTVDKIHNEMNQIVFTPFTVKILGVGVFPTLKHLRVVWVGIQEGANELEDIYNQLEPKLHKLGLKPDTGGFSPHITIARVRTGRSKSGLISGINKLANHEFGILKAKCLKLKKSNLTPKGPIYSTLKEVCR